LLCERIRSRGSGHRSSLLRAEACAVSSPRARTSATLFLALQKGIPTSNCDVVWRTPTAYGTVPRYVKARAILHGSPDRPRMFTSAYGKPQARDHLQASSVQNDSPTFLNTHWVCSFLRLVIGWMALLCVSPRLAPRHTAVHVLALRHGPPPAGSNPSLSCCWSSAIFSAPIQRPNT